MNVYKFIKYLGTIIFIHCMFISCIIDDPFGIGKSGADAIGTCFFDVKAYYDNCTKEDPLDQNTQLLCLAIYDKFTKDCE